MFEVYLNSVKLLLNSPKAWLFSKPERKDFIGPTFGGIKLQLNYIKTNVELIMNFLE